MRRSVDPAALLALFLGTFGALVLVAIAFTPTFKGRITNLVCGVVILGVAGILLIQSKKAR